MKFDYNQIITTCATLEILDTGNVFLIGQDTLSQEYYLCIQTILGQTTIIKYGPIIPEITVMPNTCNYTYSRIDYNERKIAKQIESFLNPSNFNLVEARICELDEIKSKIRNFINCLE